MEAIKDISILFQANKPLCIDNVEVVCSPKFNQKTLEGFDIIADNKWEQILKDNPRFYNASKFRLHSVLCQDQSLLLNLGLTDYKSTLCTNHSEEIKDLEEKGLKDYGDKQSYLSNSLGVGSIVLSADNYIVLIKRAEWVAEAKGLVDTPGGHAEPQEIITTDAGKDGALEDIYSVNQEVIRYELYHSMVREVRDELNIPEESISFPYLIGVVRNETLGGKPGLVFYLSTSLSQNEIKTLYSKGGLETDESTQLIFVNVDDLLKESEDTLKIISNMAPCGQAAMMFYFEYKKKFR